MMLRTFEYDGILGNVLSISSLVINMIYIFSGPLILGWTCQLLVLAPMFYICDGINVVLLAISALLKFKDEFGILKESIRDTGMNMLKNGGVLQLLFIFPWDIIPLVIASKQGECAAFDTMYRCWAFLRALKMIPAWAFLIRKALHSKILYVSVQVGRLLKSIFGLLLLVHMSACFFFSLSASQQSDKSWVTKVIFNEGGAHTMLDQYILSIYYAMHVFVFTNRYCETDIEWIYSIFELVIATMIYGSFFGMIHSILKSSLSNESIHRKKQFKFRFRQIHSYMCENRFPKELQDCITRHGKIKFLHLNGLDEKMVWKNLPKDLHQEIVTFLYGDILNSISIFRSHDHGFISALALLIEPCHVIHDTILFKVGDEAQDMYIILNGEIEISTPSVFGGENVVRSCKRGDYIGDVALLLNEIREVTAKTLIDSDLGRISRRDLDILLMRFPNASKKMMFIVQEKIRQTITASMEHPGKISKRNTLQRILSFGNNRNGS